MAKLKISLDIQVSSLAPTSSLWMYIVLTWEIKLSSFW